METITNPATCVDCESTFDLDTDNMHWANLAEDWLCESCYESETMYSSTVFCYGPDFPNTDDGPVRFYVSEKVSMTMWGDDPDLTFTRTYHPTDGWRGYHVTKIEGWEEVGLEGWTTGGWDDPIARRKQDFNTWAERLATHAPPVNVAIATDPTSNVFSTAITVYIPEGTREAFDEWLDGRREILYNALG